MVKTLPAQQIIQTTGTPNISKVEAEQAKTDALFFSIGEGAISTDGHGKIDRVNKIALDMLGYREQDLLGKWYPGAIKAVTDKNKLIKITNRPITKAFLTGRPIAEKLFYRRKDGSIFPVSLNVSPIMFEDKPIGAIEVFRDNTRESEIEHAKDEFIALASHQLRTPLTAIRIYSEMLANGYAGPMNPTQSKYLKMVRASIARMAALIDSLLSIARIESNTLTVKPARVAIDFILKEILNELHPSMVQKNVELKVKIGKIPKVETDEVLIKEIFANLLTNAVKYTPPGGTIAVSATHNESELCVKIQDTGLGIPQSEQSQVFSKFYRGSNAADVDTSGTGIGLYLVKRLVEYLRGKIWFESQENRGTTFYFQLPLNK